MSRIVSYTVCRIAWEGDADEGFCVSFYQDADLIRQVPVAAFSTEREAQAEAHHRNVEARAGRSPFWFTDNWKELTDLNPEDAAARISMKGLPSPQPRHQDDTDRLTWRTLEMWREWWDRESVNWNEQQLANAWAVFNKLRFYDVVEIELED